MVVWERNNSQLIHADALTVLPDLPRPALWLLDLPYGIALRNHDPKQTGRRKKRTWTLVNDDDQSFGSALLEQITGPVVAFASPKSPWPGTWRQHLVWNKGPAVGGGGDPGHCWKMTWELIQVRETGILNGGRDCAVLDFPICPSGMALHPCQKPLGLLKYLVQKTTQPGDLVIDLTCGSGSVILAAMGCGRRAIGVEIDPAYVQTALGRLRQPVLMLDEESCLEPAPVDSAAH